MNATQQLFGMGKATRFHWPPTGMYLLKVAGCSYYRSAIESIVDGVPGRAGEFAFVPASLVLDPANEHDPNAVAVTIGGQKVGHVPREHAPAVRDRILKCDIGEVECAAVVSGGLVTPDRQYDFVIELDVDLASECGRGPCPVRPDAVSFGGAWFMPGRGAGVHVALAWLPLAAVDDMDRRRSVMSWTTDDWDTVNYYLSNSRRIGLGHKLMAFEKGEHLRLFGPNDPGVGVVWISGRVVMLAFSPAPAAESAGDHPATR